MDWALSQANEDFNKVFALALKDGPQEIHAGNEAVVVLSEETYKRLTGEKKSFVEHLLSIPSLEGVDLTREKDMGRDIDL